MTEYEKIYLKCMEDNYMKLIQICKDVCNKNREEYSEDILNDTVVQVHKIILKKGKLDDMSEDGILRYFVRSYVNNLRCEKRYAYNKKRDNNISQEEFNLRYENSKTSTMDKIIEVNNWVKNNLSRNIIKKEFNEIYGDLITI